MKILVTGANGFIGKYVCDRLKGEYDVIGLGTASKSAVLGIEYYKVNIESSTFVAYVKDKVQACDVIIHLAAYIDMGDFDDYLIDVNCKGTSHIVQLAKELQSKKIIHLSSLPVVGQPRILPITEEHETKPSTLYHITKLMAEYIIDSSTKYSINSVNLRIPSPIGVGMKDNTILPILLKNSLKNKPIIIFGEGKRRQNYIDVRDIVEAIFLSIKSDIKGIYNIASEVTVSNLELAQLCKKVTRSSSEIIFNGKQDPQENICWETSIEKAKKELNFKPMYTIEDSILFILKNGDNA